jgi:rhamnosyltransferase
LNHTKIFAIIVSYNGVEDLLKTATALRKKVGHIHIVDNSSASQTINILKVLEQENDISVTYLTKNEGIGYALNIGVKKACEMKYNWLLTMDQDSIVDENMIFEFCKVINQDSTLCCLTPTISVFGDDKLFNNRRKKENTVNYAITSGNLINTSVYESIGLYNEKLFIDCVDFDFSFRLREANYKISIVPKARLYHQLGEESNVPKLFSNIYTLHSPLRRYYMYRNWGYIIQKYFFKFPLLILKSTLVHILLLIIIPFYDKNPKKSMLYICYGIRDYFRNSYGPIFKTIKTI